MEPFHIAGGNYTAQQIFEIVQSRRPVVLSEEAKHKIIKCREFLDKKIAGSSSPIYGVNTGFGSLYSKSVSDDDLEQLQANLVMSHACGTGELVPLDIVRLMLVLKAIGLSFGKSGVQFETVERLLDLYNNDILPVIYSQGSLGASGDLAPLAHLCLPLIGMGELHYKGERKEAKEILSNKGLNPVSLKSKEGLALLNGTQFMSSYGVYCIYKASRISKLSDIIAAISLEGFNGRLDPFYASLHTIRPHSGQIETAKNFNILLQGSELINREGKHVQDPYSFRCIPQVHGASKDALGYVSKVFETEINSVTDNPTIFPEEDVILSGGNFHGQPLALALDFLGLAISELGSISERRTFQLISGLRDLPPFLVSQPGLNSGLMIPQYTAASLASKNKQLCTPASADSIVSSNGQEDHVSMGANAATKALEIINNTENILAIELLTAAQAIEFRRPGKTSPLLEDILTRYRKIVPKLESDRILYTDIEKTKKFITELEIKL